jgi:hypothetical protein
VVLGIQETELEEPPKNTRVKEHRAVATARETYSDAVFELLGLVTREY